jgi:hypothetical protein
LGLGGLLVEVAGSGEDQSDPCFLGAQGACEVPMSEVVNSEWMAVHPGSRIEGVAQCGHCLPGLKGDPGDSVDRGERVDLIRRDGRLAVVEPRLIGWWSPVGQSMSGAFLTSS